jgi:hypothetical protein
MTSLFYPLTEVNGNEDFATSITDSLAGILGCWLFWLKPNGFFILSVD